MAPPANKRLKQVLEVRGLRLRPTALFGIVYATAPQLYCFARRGHFEPESVLVVGLVMLLFAVLMQKPAWVRHDEHYHVDFGVAANSPGLGDR